MAKDKKNEAGFIFSELGHLYVQCCFGTLSLEEGISVLKGLKTLNAVSQHRQILQSCTWPFSSKLDHVNVVISIEGIRVYIESTKRLSNLGHKNSGNST